MKYDAMLRWIEKQKNKTVEELIAWSSINSHSFHNEGLKKQREAISEKIKSCGWNVEECPLPNRISVDDNGKQQETTSEPALVVTLRPSANKRILLSGHMDTVFPRTSMFQSARHVDENTLVGPGVADMKGGLLVALLALQAFETTDCARNIGWQFVINPDEEIGSPSSKNLLLSLAANANAALVFEPAFPDGAFISKRGGSLNMAVIARGKMAHAGRDFSKGKSALYALTSLVNEIEKMNHNAPKTAEGEPLFTANVGALHSGHAYNIVPDLALCKVNLRAVEAPLLETGRNTLLELIKICGKRDGISMESVETSIRFPTVDADRSLFEILTRCATELQIPVITRISRGVSDANIFSQAGTPVLDSLGPIGSHLHTEQESVDIPSIIQRAQLTFLLLTKIATEA